MAVKIPLVIGPHGLPEQLQPGDSIDVGGIGIPTFGSIFDADTASIPDSADTIQVLGFNTPGDAGGGVYERINSLPSYYVGNGSINQAVPPSVTSGGSPITIFATTSADQVNNPRFGPSTQPIYAGCLTVVIINDIPSSPPSTFTDTSGNVYTQVILDGNIHLCAIYVCTNPVFAPIGTFFDVPLAQFCIAEIFSVPSFIGAILDVSVSQITPFANTGTGISLATGVLTAAPEYVFALSYVGGNPIGDASTDFQYTLPAGWEDLSPPLLGGRNVIACAVSPTTAGLTFNPTWSTSLPFSVDVVTLLVTFKTFSQIAFNTSFWSLVPTWPIHTAQYGIVGSSTEDVRVPFVNFSTWMASIAPSSSTGTGGSFQTSATVTITIANPAVITIMPADGGAASHGLRNGQAISFSTTGALPAPIVAGQIYYIQYGTVTPFTFQISETSLFGGNGAQTVAKGTSISTLGGSQSGVHSYTVYGELWTDFVLDPGIYYSTSNQAPVGFGLKKWRMYASQARFQTNVFFHCVPWNDINSSIPGQSFQTQFQSTNSTSSQINSITLVTAADATQFYVNSWVLLMCNEIQGQNVTANWNPATFEFAKVKSVNAGSGVITFYDTLQYNYLSTFPVFLDPNGTGLTTGPATISQISDCFDQEIEIHGLTLNTFLEEETTGVLSLKLVDCEIFGAGFHTGPFPSAMRKFTVERCKFHNVGTEIDKAVDTIHYIDCDFDNLGASTPAASHLIFQSASINKTVIERCKMVGGLQGTGKDITIRDSYIAGTFIIGPVYGVTERIALINSHIENTESANQDQQIIPLVGTGMTFVNGTIKLATGNLAGPYGPWNGPAVASICPYPWAIPGAKIAVCSGNSISAQAGFIHANAIFSGMITAFTVLNVYMDGSNHFCIDTTMPVLPSTAIDITATIAGTTLNVTALSPADAVLLSGMVIVSNDGTLPAGTVITTDIGVPNGTAGVGAYTLSHTGTGTDFTASVNLNYLPHECPRMTVINCTGGRFVADQNGAPPDIPMYSYFKRAFSGGQILPQYIEEAYVFLAGQLLTLEIDVIKPYTGAAATYKCGITMFGWAVSSGNYYPTYITQLIDLKTVGKRIITSTAVVGSVGADSLTAVPFWLTGGHWVTIGPTDDGADTLAKFPYFVVTGQADQLLAASFTTTTPTGGLSALADTVIGMVTS